MKRTVLVYRSMLLPYSETFIKEQILACKRWRAILVGRREVGGLTLDGLEARVLEPGVPSISSRARGRIRRQFGLAPPLDVLRRENPRLLHVHFGSDAVKAAPIARGLGIPMLVTLHGYDINIHREWWEAGHGGFEMRSYPRRLLHLSRQPNVHFIAVSRAIRSRAIEFGIPVDRIAVRHIGIDTEKFAPSGRPTTEREPRVLFVGRLVEKKGCRYLIEAMAEVQKAVVGAKLIVVGDGPLRPALEQLAQSLDVRVEFRGARSSGEVKRELDRARVFCLPSVTAANGDAEGFGMVLLEAQACGVPVVTSARGGAVEGIDPGVTGFAFSERDANTCSSRLIHLLSDDAVARKMAVAARRFVAEHFDLVRCSAMIEEHYDELARAISVVPECRAPGGVPDEKGFLMNSQRVRTLYRSIAHLPLIGPATKTLYRTLVPLLPNVPFGSSSQYWDERYGEGGTSGAGSYGRLAAFKAETLNRFVAENGIGSVIEFGSGDGAQLELAEYLQYTGIDVSERAIEICRAKFRDDPRKQFFHAASSEADTTRADLAMSLDVIYHLVEDDVYHAYMSRLVAAADRFVCVYSSNAERSSPAVHVRHRCFTDWLTAHAPGWSLKEKVSNPYPEDPRRPDDTSWADFYFFEGGSVS